jgi:hypothetical protein
VDGQADLLETVLALSPSSRFSRRLDGGQQQRNEDTNAITTGKLAGQPIFAFRFTLL